MKRDIFFSGMFGVMLVLGLLTMGCKTTPYEIDLSFWQAADKKDLQKMEEVWGKADQKTKDKILWEVLCGEKVYTTVGFFDNHEHRIQLTEANAIPVLRFLLNNGVGINDPIKDSIYIKSDSRSTTISTPLNLVIGRYKNWPQPLGYHVVTFLLENGADPNIKESYFMVESNESFSGWYLPLHKAKELKDDKLIALLIDHGAKDVKPLFEISVKEYASSNLPTPATPAASTAAIAPAAPALQSGTYQRSDIRGHELVLISSPFKQATYKIDGRSEAQGVYEINGMVLIIEYTMFFGSSELRNQLQGKKLVYNITSDRTFSGNGQSWVR
jgi:hypothetical protein